ncbi:MAG: hypothetical protein GEU93_16150 [Propionibacteriales bacterium]|nr:hypothetical protein [Propionibacteriales bacterium]
MSVSPEVAGRTFPETPPYDVSRAKIREFATAIGAEPADETPMTFPVVVGFDALQRFMTDPDVGISLHRVVHGDQRFVQTRPVRAGDVLTAELTVESLRQGAGTDIIGTRTEIRTTDGEHVATSYATLVHRGAEPAE